MQVLPHSTDLKKINISDLPLRVHEEVFPIFEQVILPGKGIVVGVSSGVDSMTLACLLIIWYHQKQFPLQNIHIVHCNHKLRKQSEEEEQFIQTFFHGLPLHLFHRDSSIGTTEKELRERRYECFEEIIEKNPSTPLLFLAHHLEDRIESSFLHCIRGAGLKGFLNMRTLQSHPLLPTTQVCRPLLNITKNDFIAFCEQFQIRFFTDESNADPLVSQRNFLRHEIMEKLIGIHHGNNHFLQSMRTIYTQLAEIYPISPSSSLLSPAPTFPSWNAEYCYHTTSTDILAIRSSLNIYSNLRHAQIQEWNKRLTTTQSGWKEIKGIYFFFHEKQLYIIKANPAFWKEKITEKKLITHLGIQEIAGIKVEVKEERLLGATLRFPEGGDRFAGKTRNRRALNQKIPVWWRNFIPLAVKEGKIIHMRKEVMQG